MDYDTDKVDNATLTLMALVVCEREEGYLGNPKGKARSVVMTEEGYQKSQELFEKLFRS